MIEKNFTSLLIVGLLAVGCGGNNEDNAGPSGVDSAAPAPPAADSGVVAPTPDSATEPSCTYPEGPYGTQTGEIVANLEFEGYADPDYLCKANVEMQMDLTTKRTLSFEDYFCNTGCPEKKRDLLWVIVSAGWCGPCQDEVSLTQSQFEVGAIDSRVHVLDIVYETDRATPVTEEFAKLWAENNLFQLTMPVAMDPAFRMAAYFDRDAVPFNMLIDLATMKIIFRQTGSNLPAVGQALHEYLLAP